MTNLKTKTLSVILQPSQADFKVQYEIFNNIDTNCTKTIFCFFTETTANWHSIIKNTKGNTAQLSFEWSHFKLQSPCTPQ